MLMIWREAIPPCHAGYFKMESKKAQMKIQEMAFVLVAIMIFFAIVAIIFFKVGISGLQNSVESQRAEQANELVQRLASTPEFAFTAANCQNCIDMDKVILLKDRNDYKSFWSLDFLQIQVLYPKKTGECNTYNYPDCGTITIVNNSRGIPQSAYVSLCRIEFEQGNYVKCDLGRIYASGKSLNSGGSS